MADDPTAVDSAPIDDRHLAPRAAEEHTAYSISSMRERIDEIDTAIIGLWQERAGLSQRIGTIRVAAGGTRLILSREYEILQRFRGAIGAAGTQLALLLLKAGRGPL
jgi:chorismate mutase